jgi:DNA modification methylase
LTIANESTADSNHNPSSKTEWSGSYAPTGKDWNVYCGDTREVLCRLPRNHYTCVITSPPYYWQRDYGVEGQIGIEPTVEGYVKAVCDVMDGVKDVLNPKRVLFLNLGDTYYSGKGRPKGMDRKHNGRRFSTLRAVDTSGLGPPKKTLLGMPWRVTLAMIDRGWILRSSIIWRRENAVPEPNVRDRPCRTYEFVFLFAKARQYRFSRRELRNLGVEDVWTIESQSRARREHPAVFPPELVERCLSIGNSGHGPVLDPFAGSGTVLRVALGMDMPADGIDLNPVYCRSMAKEFGRQVKSRSG